VESQDDDDDDTSREKLLTRPQELSCNPTSRDICERVVGMDEGMKILRISI
jgi:hypothetical protein